MFGMPRSDYTEVPVVFDNSPGIFRFYTHFRDAQEAQGDMRMTGWDALLRGAGAYGATLEEPFSVSLGPEF